MPIPPKSSTIPPLRLHRDETDGAENSAPHSYKFPVTVNDAAHAAVGPASRRLVAGRVNQAPVERCMEGSACAVLHGGDDPDCIGRIMSSRQLVAEIENTLDRMQNRLSDFRGEVDRAFRFPSSHDRDDLPPAA